MSVMLAGLKFVVNCFFEIFSNSFFHSSLVHTNVFHTQTLIRTMKASVQKQFFTIVITITKIYKTLKNKMYFYNSTTFYVRCSFDYFPNELQNGC